MAAHRRLLRTAAALAVLGLSGCDRIPGTDASRIRVAHQLVGQTLQDPYSAKYSEDVAGHSTKAVCGFVNARNAYGAYVGPAAFIVINGRAELLSRQPDFKGLTRAVLNEAEFGGDFRGETSEMRVEVSQACAFAERWAVDCKDHPKSFPTVVRSCAIWKKTLGLAY